MPLDSPPAPVRWDDDLVRLYQRHYDGLVHLTYLASGEPAVAYLHLGRTTEPVAVRVDVVDPGTGDRVLAHASVAVPGAQTTGARTATTAASPRTQITIVSAKDADLGVGGFRVGLEPGEPYVRAGHPAVFSVPCRGAVAVLHLVLDSADGTNLRIDEVWPC